MEVLGVHHVAMAVEDLDAAVDAYTRLFGAHVEERGRVEEQGVDAAYLRVGADRIELVSPLGPDTPVGRFLAKRGPGVHHVALEVPDAEAAVGALSGSGAHVIDPAPRPGFGGHPVAFVHPDSVGGVLVEMVGSHG